MPKDFWMSDLPNLPASSFWLSTFTLDSLNRAQFLEAFGPHLRYLFVRDYTYESIVDVLKQTPNLVSLEVNVRRETGKSAGSVHESDVPLQLERLKRLEFDVENEGDIEFLEYLLRQQPRLHQLKVFIKLENPELAQQSVLLLTKVPHVSLEIGHHYLVQSQLHVVMDAGNNTIRNLALSKEKIDVAFGPVELMVSKCELLEKLKLRLTVSEENSSQPQGVHSTSFKFPKLNNLRSLDVSLFYAGIREIGFSCGIFASLQVNQFPVLQEVTITIDSFYVSAKNFQFDPSTTFDSVKHLNLSIPRSINNDWSQVFPRLLKMNIKFVEVSTSDYGDLTPGDDCILNIFRNTKLVDLVVNLCKGEDVNLLLTGSSNGSSSSFLSLSGTKIRTRDEFNLCHQ